MFTHNVSIWTINLTTLFMAFSFISNASNIEVAENDTTSNIEVNQVEMTPINITPTKQLLPNQITFLRLINPTNQTWNVTVQDNDTFLRPEGTASIKNTKSLTLAPQQTVRIETHAPNEFGTHKEVIISINNDHLPWMIITRSL